MLKSIEQKLQNSFNPSFLEIQDLSHMHKGHLQEIGITHILIKMNSLCFCKKSKLEKYRMVHKILQNEIQSIHSISMILKDTSILE